MLEERADLEHREYWIWSPEDTQRYFFAGGGREGEFDALWSVAIASDRKFDRAIAAGTYAGAGGVSAILLRAESQSSAPLDAGRGGICPRLNCSWRVPGQPDQMPRT